MRITAAALLPIVGLVMTVSCTGTSVGSEEGSDAGRSSDGASGGPGDEAAVPDGDGGAMSDGAVQDAAGASVACGNGTCERGETCVGCPADCDCGEECAWVESDTGPETELSLSATARTTTVDGRTVDYVDFPLPDETEAYSLWSIWGEGEVASDGTFYASVGDHGSEGGNSWIYAYEPESKTIRVVADVLESFGEYEAGSFGYGKVHGQVDEGPCGGIYFHTYRGSTRGELGGSYDGDLLLRYNPSTEHTTVLGETISGWQTPSTNLWREGGLLYGEANTFGSDEVRFWVYDLSSQEVVWQADPVERKNRNIAIDAQGRAYYGDGPLYRFDPETEEETTVSGYPGGTLRASTRPREDGTLVVITDGGGEAHLFDPEDQSFTHIADMTGYTASVALDPSGESFYVIPGAHGGEPFRVEEYDIESGERTVLAELLGPIQDDNPSGFGPCSTYGVHVSADGSRLYAPANATQGGTGDCLRADGGDGAMVVVLHLEDR